QDLRLAALEEAGAVHAGQDADVRGELADLVRLAPVRAGAVTKDAGAHELLDVGLGRGADGLLVDLGVFLDERLVDAAAHLVEAAEAFALYRREHLLLAR